MRHLYEIQSGKTGYSDIRKHHIRFFFAQELKGLIRICKLAYNGKIVTAPVNDLYQALQRPWLFV